MKPLLKIATILPYKENYTFSKAQAAAIWVCDFYKFSKHKKENYIYGNTNTKDFLTTINKITNAYDLVLVYLVLYKDFFNLKETKILTEKDNIYMKSKHIQFNEKNTKIFNVKIIKNHMKKHLKKSLNYKIL